MTFSSQNVCPVQMFPLHTFLTKFLDILFVKIVLSDFLLPVYNPPGNYDFFLVDWTGS